MRLFLLFLGLTFLSSCVSSKKVVYFNNISDTTAGGLQQAQEDFETPIQRNDMLSIAVGGSNPEDLIMLNSGSGFIQGANNNATTSTIGYLVEADGKIQFPFLGRVQASGLSRLQLQNNLTKSLSDYTRNPVVNIKFMNYNVSVLGEVARPGRYTMDNERTTVLQALSLAGDLTLSGKRENVLIIREVNGQREFGRVNLLSKDIFKSPYFYLKTNDVVYVEPVPSKFFARTGVPQYIGLAAAGITLLLTILNFSK